MGELGSGVSQHEFGQEGWVSQHALGQGVVYPSKHWDRGVCAKMAI